jgi:ribonuclease D
MEKTISDEALNLLPLKQFEGAMTVVESRHDVLAAVEDLRAHQVIGFDTETKPSFKKGEMNQVALLQLSTIENAYLFRINKMGLHPALIELLQDVMVTKAGVAVRDDIKALRRVAHFEPAGFAEIQDIAKQKGYHDASLKKLAAILCEFRISKRQRLSNWEADVLSAGQVIYAATDAWAALLIYNRLQGNHCYPGIDSFLI